MGRFVFWDTSPEAQAAAAPLYADLAAARMQLAPIKLALKYSPAQPRVPAGNADGGQWTDAVVRPGARSGPLKRFDGIPPNSADYTAPDGTNFLAPADANFRKVYEDGHALIDQEPATWPGYIKQKVGQFGEFDFQRDGDIFYSRYTNASNYAAGLFMSGAGFSYADTMAIAGGYAAAYSAGGITGTRLRWWTYGYMAGYLNSSAFPLPLAQKAWLT
ncbi:MAG TPA: hypothetical protein VGM26_18500 [Rhizomicrobium sp.]|jgi:hypothetical protein